MKNTKSSRDSNSHENIQFALGLLAGIICSIACGMILCFVLIHIGNAFALGEAFNFLSKWISAVLVCVGIFVSMFWCIAKFFMHL